jgi:hypothetical protein
MTQDPVRSAPQDRATVRFAHISGREDRLAFRCDPKWFLFNKSFSLAMPEPRVMAFVTVHVGRLGANGENINFLAAA